MNNYYQENSNASKPFNESLEIKRRTEFSHREVGLTHPDNNAFIRIADGGSIEIFAAPGIGIIINPNTRSISFHADSIKIFSKEDDGLRWNDKSFNPASDVYNEPSLIKTGDFLNNPAYHRVNYYLNNIQEFEQSKQDNPVTISGKYALGSQSNEQATSGSTSGFTSEQIALIDSYAKDHTEEEVSVLKRMMHSGYSYQESLNKINEKDFNMADNSKNFPWIKSDLDK